MKTPKTFLCALVTIAVLITVGGQMLATQPASRRCLAIEAGARLPWQQSQSCLACHDGVVARDITPVDPALHDPTSHANHPTAVSYEQAYRRGKASLIPLRQLDPRIILLDGRIQCVSCHTFASTGTWMLVKSNRRGELCRSCHQR